MNLRYRYYQFTFEAQDQLLLPHYKGSTFRGAFGNAFRRIVCTLRRKDCRTCILKTGCIYAYVFETAPHPDAAIMGTARYTSIPHPFVIEPPPETNRVYQPGDEISFGLILIGKAVDYLPYFVYTFEEMGKTGIGKRRGRYSLRTVKSDDGGLVYSYEDRTIRPQTALEATIPEEYAFNNSARVSAKISFLTPARISYERDLVVNPDFQVIVRSLLRRLNLLYYFHGERREATWNHRAIITAAGKIDMAENHILWWDWERYSTRQGVRMKMGGFVGEATYEGDMEPFLPLLQAGEIFHLGKGTSFGLGKYKIVDVRQSGASEAESEERAG
ncbi:MAG: hypothetical protein A4E65_01679 [Syntrophorhabdus sp. PtaU1.Bin153]|nr:MAG: hypothetical protein A4E65_01679 [Syntrophorhabdus sp. PtaU1.Bin153]